MRDQTVQQNIGVSFTRVAGSELCIVHKYITLLTMEAEIRASAWPLSQYNTKREEFADVTQFESQKTLVLHFSQAVAINLQEREDSCAKIGASIIAAIV